MKVCAFVFRRDFRVHDNTALFHASEYCKKHQIALWPVFVFHETQISETLNPYYSDRCFRFLMHALHDLNDHVPIDVVYCEQTESEADVLLRVLKRNKMSLSAVFFNTDLTPYAKQRDARLTAGLKRAGAHVGAYEDYTIYPMNTVLNKSGKPYLVFTPFYNAIVSTTGNKKRSLPLPAPIRSEGVLAQTNTVRPNGGGIAGMPVPSVRKMFVSDPTVTRAWVKKHVLDDATRFERYGKERDRMGLDHATTRIGPYLKFGLVSTREALRAFVAHYGPRHELVKQLYWREFYYITHDAFPRMLRGQVSAKHKNADYNPKVLKGKRWNTSKADFAKWAAGNTGVELVDAAMRQLNETGYMHNRGRMVVASYLVKDLGIDWRKGERYFATRLIDYDPCQNNSGWQWSSGSGVSPNPWYRKFNPERQAETYDPTGAYRNRYLRKKMSV